MISVSALAPKLKSLCPNMRTEYVEALKNADETLAPFGILENSERVSMFLAQILHESGGFSILRESLHYTTEARLLEIFGEEKHSAGITREEAPGLLRNSQALAERVYGLGNPKKAAELLNTQPGDGYRYRGAGPLQMTGRGAFQQFGEILGVDLVSCPELAVSPKFCLSIAAAEWTRLGCNNLADVGDFKLITKKINGGLNGFKDRKSWLSKVKEMLLASSTPTQAEVPTPPHKPIQERPSTVIAAGTLTVSTTAIASNDFLVTGIVLSILVLSALLFFWFSRSKEDQHEKPPSTD